MMGILTRFQTQMRGIAERRLMRRDRKETNGTKVRCKLAAAAVMAILTIVTGVAPDKHVASAAPLEQGGFYVFDTLEFRDSTVLDAVRVISEQSGANIVATSEAGRRTVSLFLRRSNVKQAVESIARVSGLWYNYNRSNNVFMLMTVKEYQDDLLVFRQNYTRSFTLKHQNVVDTARVIKSLFGDRVSLTINKDDALYDFQQQVGTLGTMSNIGNTQLRQQFNGSQNTTTTTTQSQQSGRNFDQRQNQLTPGQLSLLQDNAMPETNGENGAGSLPSGANARMSGAALTAERSHDTTIYVAVNRLHNILYVRSSDENSISQIAKIVADSDRPTPQVLLEMKVLQLSVGDGFGSLFDISLSGGKHFTGGTSFQSLDSHSLAFQVVSDQLTARLQLMESQNRVKVIATPMVTATNTTPAQLFIGEERVIVTGFSQSTTVGTTGASNTYFTAQTEHRDIGTTLRIIPRINSDQTVTLLVQSDDSKINVGGGTLPVSDPNGTVQNLPIDTVSTSNIQGVVTAKDGLTVAMGGLIRRETDRNTDQVPVLGEIPGVNFFFRRMENTDTRSELVVLITPHVFFSPTKAEDVSRERVTALSANPDLSSEGMSLGYRDGDAGVQALVTLARAARLADGGMDATQLNLVLATLPASPPMQIVSNAMLRMTPRAAWRQGQLFATVVTVENLSNEPVQLDPRAVLGDWKAASFDQPMLDAIGSPMSTTTGYFFSDRPFGQVIASLTRADANGPKALRRAR